MISGRVFEAARVFQSTTPPPDASSGDPQSSSEVSHSALDMWEKRIKNLIGSDRSHKVSTVGMGSLLDVFTKARLEQTS